MSVATAWVALTGLVRSMVRLTTVLMTPTAATTVRSGVVPGGTPLVLTGSGMTGTIGIGRAVVQGAANQGAYPAAITAPESFTVNNGHTSLSRVDTVWLVIEDTDYDSSGFRRGRIVYQAGTPGSGTPPTAPPTGTAYLRLYDITVAAGKSPASPIDWNAALTDRRRYTVAVGGISPDSDTVGTYRGQVRYNNGVLEAYSGTAWVAVNPALTSVYTESATPATVDTFDYSDSTVTLSTTCVLPPSGRALVLGQANMYQNTAGYSVYSTIEAVGSTSGTIRAASDVNALRYISYGDGDNGIVPGTLAFRIAGAPGETVTLTWKHKVSGGGALFDSRNIVAVPLAG
ncbi:hypothetical protein [Kitasatospora purpeofusca]|uniref:hypothetical protein n=1 Tax=Kitasatospora purpeofusca TaxID=67352 RepID=UPI00382D57F8